MLPAPRGINRKIGEEGEALSTWSTVYLIAAIVAGAFGIWSLARGGRNPYLNIAGILWFAAILVRFYVRDVANFVIVRGLPTTGDLLLYLAVPVFMILAFLNTRSRR
jgi:hypothetical protein